MKQELMNKTYFDNHIGCFGNFDIEDLICKKYCALSLRCAIKRDKNIQMELFEDLISFEKNKILLRLYKKNSNFKTFPPQYSYRGIPPVFASGLSLLIPAQPH